MDTRGLVEAKNQAQLLDRQIIASTEKRPRSLKIVIVPVSV